MATDVSKAPMERVTCSPTDPGPCGFWLGTHADGLDERCGRAASFVDRGDGTLLCDRHAEDVRGTDTRRRLKPVDASVDRLIARNIFRLELCERDDHEHCHTSGHVRPDTLPYYAEEIEDAAKVIEALRSTRGVDLRSKTIGDQLPASWATTFSDPESSPYAICVAALSVVGVDL